MKVRLNLHGTEIVIDDLTTDEASALISNLIKNIDDNGNEKGEATLTVDESFDGGAKTPAWALCYPTEENNYGELKFPHVTADGEIDNIW